MAYLETSSKMHFLAQSTKDSTEALAALWPFLTEDVGVIVSQPYGLALMMAANVLNKKCRLEPTVVGHMPKFHIKELQP